MKNTAPYKEQKKEFHLFVAKLYQELAQFKKEGDQIAFNALFLKVLPEVKRYIHRRLTTAVSKGLLPKHKYKTDDFSDQLFIEAFDHFDQIMGENDLHLWLFKKADELLGDALVEEEFDSYFFENIAAYSKAEWDEMEEKFSTDGDGDLVMLDELDDISYHQHDYILNHVFVDDEDKVSIARLDKKLSREMLRRHSEMVLHHLPPDMRKAIELFTEHQFDASEIAQIIGRSLKEVEQLLENARKSLKTSFNTRYLSGDQEEK